MVVDCLSHLIERPQRLCGYRPAFWCAVCGRKVNLQSDKQCVAESCPNLCHARCLGDEVEFKCGNTAHLRGLAGITDSVTFTSRSSTQAPVDPPTSEDQSNQTEVNNEDGLDDLQKEELLNLLRTARKELASSKAQLSHYRQVTADLEDKRSVLVEALSVVDTLLATRSSEDFQQRSITCTARPRSIDREAGFSDPEENRASTPGVVADLPPTPPPTTTTSSPSPLPQPATESAEEQQAATPCGGERVEGSDNHPQQAAQSSRPQQAAQSSHPRHPQRKKNTAVGNNAVSGGEAAVLPKQKQARKCTQCKRWGHSRDKCPNKACEYCQGRFHSVQNCKTKLADQRQQELVLAVRESNQETLIALKTVAWQLQQPNSHLVRPGGPALTQGTQAPQHPWSFAPPHHAPHYGAAPQYFPQPHHGGR